MVNTPSKSRKSFPERIVKARNQDFSPLSEVSQVKRRLVLKRYTGSPGSSVDSIDTEALDLETPIFADRRDKKPPPREKTLRQFDIKLSALAGATGKKKPGSKKKNASTPVARSCHKSDKKSPPGSSDATALDLTESFDTDFEEEFDKTKYRHPRLCHNLGKAAVTPKERSQDSMDWVNQIVMKVNQAESFLQGQTHFLIRHDSEAVHVDTATKMKQFIQGGPLREMYMAMNELKMNTDPNRRGILRKDVRDGLIQIGSGLVLCGLFTALIGTGKGRRYDTRPPKPIQLLGSVFGELKAENHRLCPCCRQEKDACLKAEECTCFVPFSANEGNNSAGVGEATGYVRTSPVGGDDSSNEEEFDFYHSHSL